jgi:ABC-type nitrate/sulfonate/bicarbonate transport system ATPase subunit
MSGLNVRIDNKQFANGSCAIRNLQLQAGAGEFVAVIGPSGAGKSTLLKIISGLDTQFEGAVQLPAQSRLGFMFQEPRLMPWLTVAQNLALVNPAMTGALLQSSLEQVGLGQCAQLFPGQLSGGMQRRVALLRAFSVSPQLLLMDEPFQSLDAPTAEQLRSLLMELWQQTRPTVLFVTHNLSEALSLADRVLFLSPGPASVVLELPVDLARPRAQHSAPVQALRSELLQQHPELLKGRLSGR